MLLLNQTSPLLASLDIPTERLKMEPLLSRRQKEKVLIIMGATGVGKSKLSMDLARRFPAEIINSDKMQMFEGLDITTNKITEEEQCGIPHHLLGILNPNDDFTAENFCEVASLAIDSISNRGQLPIIVGGSNSYIEALIDDKDFIFRTRYDCCFLWVDVSMPVLHSFLSDRVDRMIENGMVDEVRNIFDRTADYSKGIRKAIGVPEFDEYFKEETFLDEENRKKALKKAIQKIKDNTCELACRQLKKIHRLRNVKRWNIHRIDATEVFRKCSKPAEEAEEKRVVGPSTTIVAEFLYNFVSMEVPACVADIRDHITQCLVT